MARILRFGSSVVVTVAALLVACSRPPVHQSELWGWDESSLTFKWPKGEVKLPSGCSHQADMGGDTVQGHFLSPNGVVVRYDIGDYAGAWAAQKKAFSFNERYVNGARVWVASRDWPDGKGGKTILRAVTFPDSGCANFYVTSSNTADLAILDSIAQSFRPRGEIKTAARPVCY